MTSPPEPSISTTTPVLFNAPVRRLEPPQVADERESLEGWLDYFRSETVLALDGLTEAELGRRIPETGLSLLGVLKHLTELERIWLVERWGERGGRIAHQPSYVDDPDAGVRVSGVEHSDPLVVGYQTTCERARDALAGAESLDDAVRDDRRGHIELRWILLHLITETARYAGQAQTLREVLLAARAGGPQTVGPQTVGPQTVGPETVAPQAGGPLPGGPPGPTAPVPAPPAGAPSPPPPPPVGFPSVEPPR